MRSRSAERSFFRLFAALLLTTCVTIATAAGTARDATSSPLQSLKQHHSSAIEALMSNPSLEHMSIHPSFGNVQFLRLATPAVSSRAAASLTPLESLAAFLPTYNVLGLRDAHRELISRGPRRDVHGLSELVHHTYEQRHHDLPVYGCNLVLSQLNGALRTISGAVVPSADLDAARLVRVPTLSPDDAVSRAAAALGAVESAKTPQLVIFHDGLLRQTKGALHVAYSLVLRRSGGAARIAAIVGAHSGAVLDHWTMDTNAMYRQLSNVTLANVIWREGDAPTLVGDMNRTMVTTMWTYSLFLNAFNRDSWDGNGAQMKTVFDDPRISCPNANWDGQSTNYCAGVAGVDTVAHEWGHAYTEGAQDETHALVYYWQSGALNEAYSDITGETVDFLFNTAGQYTPNGPRAVGDCSAYQPSAMSVVLKVVTDCNEPLLRGFGFMAAQQGAPWVMNFSAPLRVAMDSSSDPSLLCSASAVDLAGSIALVERGGCDFVVKVANAMLAGADAVLIANTDVSSMVSPAGVNANVPVAMISATAGRLLYALLETAGSSGEPVVLTVAENEAFLADSYRWLSGEEDPAFGGAIRDMWNPNCFSDPASVLDPLYHCSESDNGGVHTNSGVVNHMYAMLVDGTFGGEFNGATLDGIGYTKAFHIYWRAAFTYHTPLTTFAQHGAALAQSCEDLMTMGDLPSLLTGGPSGQTVVQADCDQVSAAAAAVQLAQGPDCDFEPLLDPNPPPGMCSQPTVAMTESFASVPAGWTAWANTTSPTWQPRQWEYVSALPDGRPGNGYFAVDPNVGDDCALSNQAGVLVLQTAAFTVPNTPSPLVFLDLTHYIATEQAFDGGVISLSRNGAPFVPLPEAAGIYNGYTARLLGPPLSTNPLGGLYAFSGTYEGSPTGSWATSRMALEAKAGDSLRLRFGMGSDCATGMIGWYLGEVAVSTCPAVCGDGLCTALYENCTSCAEDCECVCGDGQCATSAVAVDCPADCCGDGICAPHELCSVDCCGTLPDCSFETPSMWAVTAVEDVESVLVYSPGDWYSGDSGLLITGVGRLDPDAEFVERQAINATTTFSAKGAESLLLSFALQAVCLADGEDLSSFVTVAVNGRTVWRFPSGANASLYCKTEVSIENFVTVSVPLRAEDWDIATDGSQNTLSFGGSAFLSLALIDAVRLEQHVSLPVAGTCAARSCRGPVGLAVGMTLLVVVVLAGVGVALAWVFRRSLGSLAASASGLIRRKSYQPLERVDDALPPLAVHGDLEPQDERA